MAGPAAVLVAVVPETVAGVVLGIAVVVAVPGTVAGLAEVAPGTVVEADLGTVAEVGPGTAVEGVGEGLPETVVEEADLETVAEADPERVAVVEADSGTAVVVVDIVVDLPPAQSSVVLTQLPQRGG